MVRQAVLLLTHLTDNRNHNEFFRIQKELPENIDTYILFHKTTCDEPVFPGKVYSFTDNDLARIGFPMFSETLVPGSTHFPLLDFARNHPAYDYYWVIEYDVCFRGRWSVFFDHFESSEADLLTCHIRSYQVEPDWHWWGLKHPRLNIPSGQRLRSFNPIYRISSPALNYIEKCHREQWCGHYEELLPTLLHHGGYRLQDIGGTGAFVKPGDRNRFYIDSSGDRKGRLKEGTMRFRPPYKKTGWRRNKLYHPVKVPADIQSASVIKKTLFPFPISHIFFKP